MVANEDNPALFVLAKLLGGCLNRGWKLGRDDHRIGHSIVDVAEEQLIALVGVELVIFVTHKASESLSDLEGTC